jgi:large-conductance mechanosensitive channel
MISSIVKEIPSNSKTIAANLNNLEIVNTIANPIYSGFTDFFSFLDKYKIIGTTMGMVIGLQMSNFWTEFTKSIIDPISQKIVHEDINHLHFTIFEMEFYYGKVLISLINILISFYFLYQLYKLAILIGFH